MAHILLVEDSEIVGAALRVLLESDGHAVRIARSVMEAKAALASGAVELAILDLTLPDGDGLSVAAAAAAATAEGDNGPILMALTGRDDDATIARCRAAGCADVLLKPVPSRELLARVGSLISSR